MFTLCLLPQAFLYVCSKHRVLGLVLTEGIRSARRIAEAEGLHAGSEGGSEFIEADLNPEDEKPGRVSFLGDGCTQGLAGSAKRAVSPVIQKQVTGHPGERSAPRGIVVSGTGHTVSAVCGVRAMWVAADARRQKIATKLLDSARWQLPHPPCGLGRDQEAEGHFSGGKHLERKGGNGRQPLRRWPC